MKTCSHILTDGRCCESPALRGKRYCYFHFKQRARRNRMEDLPCVPFPILDDENAIQVAITQVIDRLNLKNIDHRTAALMLSGLKIASQNAKRVNYQRYGARTIVLPDEDRPKKPRPSAPSGPLPSLPSSAPGSEKKDAAADHSPSLPLEEIAHAGS